MFELMDGYSQNAVIKVLGVGGGGGNAVKHMVSCGIEGVDFICANTDSQALQSSNVRTALQIGPTSSHAFDTLSVADGSTLSGTGTITGNVRNDGSRVDTNAIEARQQDGVLRVRLGKAEEAKPKQIEVKVA